MPINDDFLDALEEPGHKDQGLQTAISGKQRLSMAMRLANDSNPADIPEPTNWSSSRMGVPNPYGTGLAAFEPNNVIFDAYRNAKATSDKSKADEALKADAKLQLAGGAEAGTTLGNATGKVGAAIQAALNLAARRVPYVWGGTSANGLDCSGLIYYAFRSAGLDVQRWRAKDYGQMGREVSLEEAKPGDLIYYDEPGDTDHIGLYLGGGRMVQAPQSGDVVRVTGIGKPTSIRRLFDDDAFGVTVSPSGAPSGFSYNGQVWNPAARAGSSTITRPTTRPSVGRTRAI